jgi:hypothetical protein
MALFDFIQQTSYSFEGKKENEKVSLFLHRHWYTVFSRFLFLVVICIAPILAFAVVGPQIASNGLIPLFAFVWAWIIMICWLVFFYTLMIYTLDTWLVTDMRIINSEQIGFFQRNVSELSIGNIQDVSIKIDGAMATMMNYGDIEVQTAGGAHHFTFGQIPNPQKVKDVIIQVVDEYKLAHPNGGSSL